MVADKVHGFAKIFDPLGFEIEPAHVQNPNS